jgi:hypothetical protein
MPFHGFNKMDIGLSNFSPSRSIFGYTQRAQLLNKKGIFSCSNEMCEWYKMNDAVKFIFSISSTCAIERASRSFDRSMESLRSNIRVTS